MLDFVKIRYLMRIAVRMFPTGYFPNTILAAFLQIAKIHQKITTTLIFMGHNNEEKAATKWLIFAKVFGESRTKSIPHQTNVNLANIHLSSTLTYLKI